MVLLFSKYMNYKEFFWTMALATNIMSSSDPSFLKALTAHKTKRQFSGVYPALGVIWSMLGEKNLGPGVPLGLMTNGTVAQLYTRGNL